MSKTDFPTKQSYRDKVAIIRQQLVKPWVDEFLEEYYPLQFNDDGFNDDGFKDMFYNFLYGRSYQAGYISPGFMSNLEKYYQSKIQNNEQCTIKD